MSDPDERILVLGLGNPILTDDGVGIHVLREVASRLVASSLHPGVRFAEASVGGIRLMEVLAGYDRTILIDAIQTPDGLPGDILRLSPGGSHAVDGVEVRSSLHAGSTHDLSFQGALVWGRETGMKLPQDDDILIVAIETEDVLTFGEACTPAVAAAIPGAVDLVLGLLEDQKLETGSWNLETGNRKLEVSSQGI
jgi:hydrogenase maturation protease